MSAQDYLKSRVTNDGGRRGRRGHINISYGSSKAQGVIKKSPQAPPAPPGDYWRVLRACFQNGLDPTAGTLCATLLEWAERRAPEPYQFVAANLADGGKVRRGLGAIARRMAADAPEEFEKAVAADGATWSFLQPYAERDAAGMGEVDDQFGDWRGVVDAADRAAVMAADAEYVR